jgi:hypothetical protein
MCLPVTIADQSCDFAGSAVTNRFVIDRRHRHDAACGAAQEYFIG